MAVTSGRRRLLATHLGEPGRLWVRYGPRRWPGPDTPWLDMATGGLGRPAPGVGAEAIDELAAVPVDDVLYVPPVAPSHRVRRDELISVHVARGTPVLAQIGLDAAVPGRGEVAVVDLLEWALSDPSPASSDLLVARLPEGAAAVAWPLLPGQTDEAVLEAVAGALVAAGVGCLHGIVVDLDPAERRRLAEAWPGADAMSLFHAAPADPAALLRICARHGLDPLLPRPIPEPPLVGGGNLAVAGALARAAELSARRGDPVSRSQSFARAARWAEQASFDIAGLAREGNLGVLPWLEAEARRLVTELCRDGGSPLLDELAIPPA